MQTKYDKWNKLLDDLFSNSPNPKEQKLTNSQSPKTELSFDFELIAFNRLKHMVGDSKISLKEYYRKMAVLYSLNKDESKLLLRSLRQRFSVNYSKRYLWINFR